MNRLKHAVAGFLAVLGLMLGAATLSMAASSKSIDLSPEQVQSVNKVSDYLNSFTTMQGDFTQISPKGGSTKGTMYISKPGKIRFDYAAPNPFLLVSDGTWVTLKNRSKETGDQFPLSSTPLRLVLAPKVDLAKDTYIQAVEKKDGLISVTLEDRKSSMGGQIVLVFDESQNHLQQWMIIDSKNRRTTVVLENLKPNVTVDPALFVVKINRKTKQDK